MTCLAEHARLSCFYGGPLDLLTQPMISKECSLTTKPLSHKCNSWAENFRQAWFTLIGALVGARGSAVTLRTLSLFREAISATQV